MPFESFGHPCFKQCLQPSILSPILVVSSVEGLVSTSVVEDRVTVTAVEHSATEVALYAQYILNMVVQIHPV